MTSKKIHRNPLPILQRICLFNWMKFSIVPSMAVNMLNVLYENLTDDWKLRYDYFQRTAGKRRDPKLKDLRAFLILLNPS